MDYKELLKKYMWFINEIEGTDFTGRSLELENLFSLDEKKELREIGRANRALLEAQKRVRYAPVKR